MERTSAGEFMQFALQRVFSPILAFRSYRSLRCPTRSFKMSSYPNPLDGFLVSVTMAKNECLQNLQLHSISVRSSSDGQSNTINVDKDTQLNGFSFFVIKYKGFLDILSLSYHDSDRSVDEVARTLIGQVPSSYFVPEASTSYATVPGIETDSRKRTQPPEEGNENVPKRLKTFTLTCAFEDDSSISDVIEPVNVDELINDVPLDVAKDEEPALSANDPGTSAYSRAFHLDDNSNYSSVLTDEEKFDSFFESLME